MVKEKELAKPKSKGFLGGLFGSSKKKAAKKEQLEKSVNLLSESEVSALEEEDEESKVGLNSDEIEINESDLDSVISWVNTIMEET